MSEQSFFKAEAMLAHLRARGVTVAFSDNGFALETPAGAANENDLAALRGMLQALGLATRSAAHTASGVALQGQGVVPALVDVHSPDRGKYLSLPLVPRDVEVMRHKAGAWFSSPLGVGATLFAVLLQRYQQKEDWLREIGVAIAQQPASGEIPRAWFSMPSLVRRLPADASLREAVSQVAEGLLDASLGEAETLDLALVLPDSHEDDVLTWHFASDLFDEAFVRQLHDDFVAIMRQATALITPMLSAITLYGAGGGYVAEAGHGQGSSDSAGPVNVAGAETTASAATSAEAIVNTDSDVIQPFAETPFLQGENTFDATQVAAAIPAAVIPATVIPAADDDSSLPPLARENSALWRSVQALIDGHGNNDLVAPLSAPVMPPVTPGALRVALSPWQWMPVLDEGRQGAGHRHNITSAWFRAARNADGSPLRGGGIDSERAQKALAVLVERHALLRTTFEWQDTPEALHTLPGAALPPGVCQVVHDNIALPWRALLVSTTEDLRAAARQWLEDAAAQPLSLTGAAPWQASVATVSNGLEAGSLWRITLHAAVGDRHLAERLMAEWVALYEGATLPPLAEPYHVWAERQQVLLHEVPAAFWQEQLQQARPLVWPLAPQALPGNADASANNDSVAVFQVDAALMQRVRVAAAAWQVSVDSLLLTAFATLVQRYAGHDRFVVAVEFANREEGYSAVPGVTAAALPLVVQLEDARPAVRHRVEHLDGQLADLALHQSTPPVTLLPLLARQRRGSNQPLITLGFSCMHEPLDPCLPLLARGLEAIPCSRRQARYGLALNLRCSMDTATEGELEFAPDMLDAAGAEEMVQQYLHLLGALVADAAAPLLQLPLMSLQRQQEMFDLFNRDAQCLPSFLPHFLMWWQRQCFSVGHNLAVVAAEGRVNYGELDAFANQIARYLVEQGIGPGTRVGLLLPRDPVLLAGVLALFKVGAAYVPLHAGWSAQYQQAVLADAGATCVFHDSERTPWQGQLPALDLSLQAAPWQGFDADAFDEVDDVSGLACILYPVEQQQVPCGIPVGHRNLAALVAWSVRMQDGRPPVRAAFTRDLCASTALLEVFATLGSGGAVVILEDLLSPVARERPGSSSAKLMGVVNHLTLTPTLAAEMLENDVFPKGLRSVTLVGESVPVPLLEALRNTPGLADITVLHACAENAGAAFFATWGEHALPAQWRNTNPDKLTPGTPVDGTQCVILDAHGQLQPWGISGQLFIGGAALCNGYWQQEGHGRFIRNPLTYFPTLGTTLFDTGYRAAWYPDGRIELLARSDDPLAAELHAESAIADALGLKLCAVLPAADAGEGKPGRVAFLRGELPARHYLQYLQRHLPTALCPDSVNLVSGPWPRMADDTLDRRTLAEIVPEGALVKVGATPNTLELQVLRLWQELLGEHVQDIDTTFLAAGGHSLLALQMAVQFTQRFGLARVPSFTTLMEHATPRKQARWLDAAMRGEEHRSSLWDALVERVAAARSALVLTGPAPRFPWAAVAGQLPGDIAACHAQYQPRENDELAALAQRYVDAIEQESLPLPAVLAGEGVGGALAVAVAAEMQQRGWPWLPVMLVDSGVAAHLPVIHSRVLHLSTADNALHARRGWGALFQGDVVWRCDAVLGDMADALDAGDGRADVTTAEVAGALAEWVTETMSVRAVAETGTAA